MRGKRLKKELKASFSIAGSLEQGRKLNWRVRDIKIGNTCQGQITVSKNELKSPELGISSHDITFNSTR